MQTPAPAKQQRGCFFYGCLSLAIITVIALVGGYFAFRYATNKAQEMVMEYTDTAAAPMPSVKIPADQLAALKQRVNAFETALEHQTNQVELALTATEINALLAESGYQGKSSTKVFVKIEDDSLQGTVSLPLFDIGPLKLDGRYLNGLATLKVSLVENVLDLRIEDIEVKGKKLPQVVLSELQKENFAKEVQNDPETAEKIARFESILIQDGKIILRNRIKP